MRWNDLTPEQQQQQKADWERLDALWSTRAAAADRSPFHRRASDAGLALFELATEGNYTGRYREVANWITEVHAELERSGRWENDYEWRISTYGTERIERVDNGFRAGADFNGRFRADFATFGEAWEAVRVLQGLGTSLFYALNWTEKPSTPDLEPDPERPIAEAYLKGLAREAVDRPPAVEELKDGNWRADGPRALSVVSARKRVSVVTVRGGSLVLECDCTTPERAHLFLGVFDALAADLLDILEWRPLE
jgi:hypothetical protein